jgi:YbbR domain-containing protein
MSESVRTWGLRLLALGIAIGLWLNVSFEDRQELTERVVEAGVSYNSPVGFVILDPVQTVNVRLRGSNRQVRSLNPYMVNIQMDLDQGAPGTFNIPLSPQNVLAPEGLEVVSISPNVIRVELEREISQRLAVVPQIVGEPAAGAVAGEPEVFPSQVLVVGPESLLARTEALSTRPISLNGHALTFEQPVAVISPDPLIQIVQPSEVTVRVPMRQPGDDDQAEDQAEDRSADPEARRPQT